MGRNRWASLLKTSVMNKIRGTNMAYHAGNLNLVATVHDLINLHQTNATFSQKFNHLLTNQSVLR